MTSPAWIGYFVSLTRGSRSMIAAGPFPHRIHAHRAIPIVRELLGATIEPGDVVACGLNVYTRQGYLNVFLPADIRATLGPLSTEPPPVTVRERPRRATDCTSNPEHTP